MKAIETKIPGVLIIETDVFGDHRGYFAETYNKPKYEALGITTEFVQDNMSFSAQRGTLRGLHWQNPPYAQAKLVSCTKGSVIDVAVDIRKGSPTFGQWVSVELSAENHRQFRYVSSYLRQIFFSFFSKRGPGGKLFFPLCLAD